MCLLVPFFKYVWRLKIQVSIAVALSLRLWFPTFRKTVAPLSSEDYFIL